MNITELAKECGAIYNPATPFSTDTITFFDDDLTAFANAIVEECAKVATCGDTGTRPIEQTIADDIRALKVKG